MSDPDRNLVDLVKSAVKDTTSAITNCRPGERLLGYALLTDDGLETLSYLALTDGESELKNNPDLLFCPTDWPLDVRQDAFDEADRILRQRASIEEDLREHVNRCFDALVLALVEARSERAFDPGVFLSVLSTDPSPYLDTLADAGIARLNDPELVERRQQYIAKWS